MRSLLPIPEERADAARNRRAVLEAFERLCARDGIEHVSMDAVAAEAGVGKGTIYRRFGDRAGLALALLSEDERTLQDAVLRGGSPLGPGASAVERSVAFVRALAGLVERRPRVLVSSRTTVTCVQASSERERGSSLESRTTEPVSASAYAA